MELEEVWKDMLEEDENGLYKISSHGRVKSFQKYTEGKIINGTVNTAHKYITVHLKDKHYRIHRLVAKYFVPNPNNYKLVDHIDGIKQNNTSNNLRWVNQSLNSQNAKRQQNNKSGVKGVHFNNRDKVWYAFWRENGRQRNKTFDNKDDAIKHRQKMIEQCYSVEHYSDEIRDTNDNIHETENIYTDYSSENWKYLNDCNEEYAISSFGRIKSFKRSKDGIILKTTNSNNYMVAHLTINCSLRLYGINRLVAEYFIPNPNQYEFVDHINGCSFDNHVDNLRWVNRSQNNQNRSVPKNNKTGVVGIFYNSRGFWQATWYENGKGMTKCFKTKEEAVAHRNQMVALHYSKEHLR
jgi:hypothetical protein